MIESNSLLKDNIALVTGGARGIGLAVGKAFSECGAKVILTDVDKKELAKSSKEVSNSVNFELDVTSEKQTENLFKVLRKKGFAPDIVVVNAGILHLSEATKMSKKKFEQVNSVNLTGAFLTAKFAAANICDGGRIIFTSSLFGIRGGAQNAAYSASKFGVIGLMQSMAADLAHKGIRVNAVAPGQIQTDMIDDLVEKRKKMGLPDPRDALLTRIPYGRLGDPMELAGTYVFLASNLSRYVTGQTIVVDGGWQVG